GLWDSLPDETLRRAAAKGELQTREQIVRQAHRMLADPRTHAKMLLFLHHWLQMDRVEPVPKDDKLFPAFTPDIIADLRTFLNLFLEDAVWEGASDYRTLLTADYVFLDEKLSRFYGIKSSNDVTEVNSETTESAPEPEPDEFVKLKLEGEQR